MRPVNTKLYIAAFVFTAIIFAGAVVASSYLNQRKTDELKAEEDQITVAILSSETQVDLLKSDSCESYNDTTLRSSLNNLATQLNYMESQVGDSDPDVFRLKRYFALLEVRDYLLENQMSNECQTGITPILYFYSDQNCSQCQTEGYIVGALEQQYSSIQTFTFDYNLDMTAVKNAIRLPPLPPVPPLFIISGKAYGPFTSLSDADNVIGPIVASSTATSTVTTK